MLGPDEMCLFALRMRTTRLASDETKIYSLMQCAGNPGQVLFVQTVPVLRHRGNDTYTRTFT